MDGALEPVLSAEAVEALTRAREEAYDRVVMRLGGKLFRLAYAWLQSRDEADDLMQKVLVGLWKSDMVEQHGGDDEHLWPYLRESMHNALIDLRREEHRRRAALAGYAAFKATIRRYFTSEDDIIAAEIDRHVDRLLGELPPRCRQVFDLVRGEDMTYAAVAKTLEVKVSTVKTLVARAYRHLREGLEAVGYSYDGRAERGEMEDTP